MNHTVSGTEISRASVMMFGRLNSGPLGRASPAQGPVRIALLEVEVALRQRQLQLRRIADIDQIEPCLVAAERDEVGALDGSDARQTLAYADPVLERAHRHRHRELRLLAE